MLNRLLYLSWPALVLASLVGCGTSTKSSQSSSMSTESSQSSLSSLTAPCDTAVVGSGYCLVWSDEFRGDNVDASKWSYERNCSGGGNNESQCYVSNSDNLWVDGEYLHIKAIKEPVNGPAVVNDDPNYDSNDLTGSGDYSSARIRTIGKGDWLYGRFEIRAKMPSGQGTWPAIWMLPTDWVYGGWAASGEIDIVEAVNLKVGGENRVHGTLHYGDTWPNNVYTGEAYQLPNGANPADDFHIYALEWEQGEIRWYVDGDHYATQTQSGWYSKAALDRPTAPYDQRFHLILNLAVGGDWAANVNDTGIDASVFPQEMVVDFVRVYQCSADPVTGRGCGSSDGQFVVNPGTPPPAPAVAVDSEQPVFTNALIAPYQWFYWAETGDVDYRVLNVGGSEAEVAQFTFNTDTGISYFQSPSVYDFRGFVAIEFDLRVVADPRSSKDPLVFRADCVYPCTSGDYPLNLPPLNTWTHYRVDLSELASAGLDLSQVNTPFIISPTNGNQRGVVLQLNDIRLVK